MVMRIMMHHPSNPALSLIDGGCAVLLEMQPNESISRYAYVDSRSRRCSLFRITARWCELMMQLLT